MTTPTTKAGRKFLDEDKMWDIEKVSKGFRGASRSYVLAIEREAAALDVEALRQAIETVEDDPAAYSLGTEEHARQVAAAYAAALRERP